MNGCPAGKGPGVGRKAESVAISCLVISSSTSFCRNALAEDVELNGLSAFSGENVHCREETESSS
jgi:hypothetical protein